MTAATIERITDKMTIYVPLFILFLGNFGLFLNLITFSSRKLRRNPCGWYFLMSNIFDFTYINFGLVSKLATDHFGSTLENKSSIYCKIRIFLTWTLPCISTGYLILTALDRCLSTSQRTKLRLFSQIKIAYRATCAPILLYSVTAIHQLYYYDLRPHCSAKSDDYAKFLPFYSLIWTALIPQSTMLVLIMGTFFQVRASHRRVAAQTEHQTEQPYSRTNSQMMIVVLAQVFLSSILISIRTVYYAYMILTERPPPNTKQFQLERLFWQISSFVFYMNFSKSFFVNTLTSPLFRKLLLQQLYFGLRQVSRWKTQIQQMIAVHVNSNTLR